MYLVLLWRPAISAHSLYKRIALGSRQRLWGNCRYETKLTIALLPFLKGNQNNKHQRVALAQNAACATDRAGPPPTGTFCMALEIIGTDFNGIQTGPHSLPKSQANLPTTNTNCLNAMNRLLKYTNSCFEKTNKCLTPQ